MASPASSIRPISATAEKVAALVKDRTAPVPVSAASRDFGLPGALWLAAQADRSFDAAGVALAQPRSGPSPARYYFAGRHSPHLPAWSQDRGGRLVCRTILHPLGLPPERFTSQAFWDALEKILPEPGSIPLATIHWTAPNCACWTLWKEKQMVSRRLLAYDTTNFYTYIASNNTRNELAQRGHNKQGRHNLRQVGLSYVLDGENGLSLCHHVYRGNVADAEEFSTSLIPHAGMLDRCQIARDTVTLVFDKGSAALGQHRGIAGSPRGLDLGAAVESGPGCLA
jgi:hypothetical protein